MARDLPSDEIYDVDYGYSKVIEWVKFNLHDMLLEELKRAEKYGAE